MPDLGYGHLQVVHPLYHFGDSRLVNIFDEGIVFLPECHHELGRAGGSERDWSSVAAGQTDLIWSFNAAATSSVSPSFSDIPQTYFISSP